MFKQLFIITLLTTGSVMALQQQQLPRARTYTDRCCNFVRGGVFTGLGLATAKKATVALYGAAHTLYMGEIVCPTYYRNAEVCQTYTRESLNFLPVFLMGSYLTYQLLKAGAKNVHEAVKK